MLVDIRLSLSYLNISPILSGLLSSVPTHPRLRTFVLSASIDGLPFSILLGSKDLLSSKRLLPLIVVNFNVTLPAEMDLEPLVLLIIFFDHYSLNTCEVKQTNFPKAL